MGVTECMYDFFYIVPIPVVLRMSVIMYRNMIVNRSQMGEDMGRIDKSTWDVVDSISIWLQCYLCGSGVAFRGCFINSDLLKSGYW